MRAYIQLLGVVRETCIALTVLVRSRNQLHLRKKSEVYKVLNICFIYLYN
jgi:hypothetical protein